MGESSIQCLAVEEKIIQIIFVLISKDLEYNVTIVFDPKINMEI